MSARVDRPPTPDPGSDPYRQALDADVRALIAEWPPLTARQCDRIAVLLWPRPRCPLSGHGSSPPGSSPPHAA